MSHNLAEDKLLTTLQALNELGKKHKIPWVDAAIKAGYRSDLNTFMLKLKTGDDNERAEIKRVLRVWGAMLKERTQKVEEVRGTSPKFVAPVKTIALLHDSVKEYIGLSVEEHNLILAKHNEWRKKYGAEPLKNDERIARTAQAWANHLLAHNKWEHSVSRTAAGLEGSLGENLAEQSGTNRAFKPNHEWPVNDWGEEVKDYDLVNKTAKPKAGMTGHFTQVVWKSTKLVGSGYAAAIDKDNKYREVWVCNYYPSGNFIGQHAKNVGF
jgi:hypothetical protein